MTLIFTDRYPNSDDMDMTPSYAERVSAWLERHLQDPEAWAAANKVYARWQSNPVYLVKTKDGDEWRRYGSNGNGRTA